MSRATASTLGCVLAVALNLVAAGCGDGAATSPSGAAPTGPGRGLRTFLDLRSTPGDPVANGTVRTYFLADAVWEANFFSDYAGTGPLMAIAVLSAPVVGAPLAFTWRFDFAPARGGTLTTGVYENAGSWPGLDGTRPRLTIGGSGAYCPNSIGRFAVSEITIGALNVVQRFHATFEFRCASTLPLVTGEVAIVADPWR